MAHVQLRSAASGARVLPFYADQNYITLFPGQSQSIILSAAKARFSGDHPLVTVDGWNVLVKEKRTAEGDVRTNEDALVSHWPPTQLVSESGQTR